MKKTIIAFSLLLLVGLALVGVGGFVLIDDAQQTLHGVCIGVGAGLSGLSIAKLISAVLLLRHPEQAQEQMEETDKCAAIISDKAKGKGFDAMSLIYGTAMLICVLLDASIAIILVMVTAYLMVYAVQVYYLAKYAKEM